MIKTGETRLIATIPLAKYDEQRIEVNGIIVTFDAVERVEGHRVLLKPNWKEYEVKETK